MLGPGESGSIRTQKGHHERLTLFRGSRKVVEATMAKRYKTFREFYPFYLTQHTHPVCRALHVIGVFVAALVLGIALAYRAWLIALLSPSLGYALGWTGHFVFERNRPASFRQPLYSFIGDLAMTRDVITGKIGLQPDRDRPTPRIT